ncbi:MAG: deoxyribonuclease IV, partial [Candidatus Omnitrophica bacterium]|nr:deoxyribonuclease IV [Candidatus Omnitrophota bacterium]
ADSFGLALEIGWGGFVTRPYLPVRILLEISAGQGTNVGYKFEHLVEMLKQVHQPDRMGVCIDTCHLFAAGYDIRTVGGYKDVMKQFEDIVGIEQIYAFHLNDSKKGLGSRVDRHEHIGQGAIGLEGFRALLNDRRFEKIPMVLETPKSPDLKEDVMNLKVLRGLIN